MSQLDKTYEDFQEISYEEFYEMFWEAVPEKIISNAYIDDNQDFIESITYDCWRLFEMDRDVTVRMMAKISEIHLFYLFRYRPSTINKKEILD